MVAERFKETWWLRGGHAQTLWPVIARRVPLQVRPERLELPDGDCVRLDWVGSDGPIVVVLPGLQGDLASPYVRGVMLACQSRGWRAVLLNYRGRGEPNRMLKSYHCGMTCDLHYLAHRLSEQHRGTPVAIVGYSVGANICLKWLGECGQRAEVPPVVSAVGISAPFHLGAVAKRIERGLSRIYQWYLLRSLRGDVTRKTKAMGVDLEMTPRELRGLNTFFKFDDRISGPWNGFDGAEDYYAKTRSDVLLRHVTVPTLVVNARNDPFVPEDLIPHPGDLSKHVTLEVTSGGGHMGFVNGRWPWSPRFWLETRIPEFLARHF